jgi:hypothetical protein
VKLVAPSPMRSIVKENRGALSVEMTPDPQTRTKAVLLFWLSAIGFAMSFAAVPKSQWPALLTYTAGLLASAVICGAAYLRARRGKDTLQVDGKALIISNFALLGSRPRVYDCSKIRRLRSSPIAWTLPRGTVAFDYGADTIRAGAGISEAEAQMLVDTIKARFPELA